MNLHTTIAALLTTAALVACEQDHGHDHAHDSEAPASSASTQQDGPDANATEAFYGEEAPMVIEGDHETHHDHEENGDHAHDEHGHAHDDNNEPHAH